MKDNADSDAAPYHSCKKRKHTRIDQGIAAPWKWDVAVPWQGLLRKGGCHVRIFLLLYTGINIVY